MIRPFAGLRPLPEYTSQVIAPPYDVLNTEEARIRANKRPWSFLHISKPEIDLPVNTNPYSEEVYAKGAENLQNMLKNGILKPDTQACYYLYSLTMDQHQQTGLVAVASVDDYNSNRIRKHEFTRPDKEDDRVRQIDALNAQTGPVFLTYKHNNIIDELVIKLTTNTPTVNVTADDGVIHKLWIVDNSSDINLITSTFDSMDCLYIADGHHRSAAASRVAAQRQANNYFLSVIFPDNQMQILDYNRVVKDLNGLTIDQFLDGISQSFSINAHKEPIKPQNNGEFGMYLNGQWYKLEIHSDKIPNNDPVASLDVSLLTDQILNPILGIEDLRRDKRIDFVGGIRGLSGLEKRVNSGEMTVAFALYPTSMQALMAVADAEQVMPPKSTWFEPKLADGIVSHQLI
ncbi:DUF1015 domain-containing protein [Candidatus Marithrix sp. Canyon 246]|uniref:DUF1015 domain-containing protein n=1 Tax=Candidatus Marithrix sp. Canyon 246 TaxID=1827136 RepID=UPI000AAF070E|nr:DUF1015 family protein [Candidatus Marithrix sp. Canyon 246]